MHPRQYPKGLGDTLEEIRAAAPYAEVFDKTSFSCLDANAVRDRFVADSRPNVLLAGIEGHICVQQTVEQLLLPALLVLIMGVVMVVFGDKMTGIIL